MLKAKELRDKAIEELEAMLRDLRKNLIETINEIRKTNKNDHPEEVTVKKRDIARLLTVLKEKELASSEN